MAGVLHGTTQGGGSAAQAGCVFMLEPPAAGQTAWTESILHSFQYVVIGGSQDGGNPWGVILDRAGNLYGVTDDGGQFGDGTVYELSPPAAGQTDWTETRLYSFKGPSTDGYNRASTLAFDAAGALYGTTCLGGTSPANTGIAFKLTPPGAGQTGWTESVLLSFDGTNGNGAGGFDDAASLLVSSSGAVYGTASGTPVAGYGLIYRLNPPAAGTTAWSQTSLYRFQDKLDGAVPMTGLIADPAGNIYGTASQGGGVCAVDQGGCGTAYEAVHP
jgi:uncharacterized repeat protein (TIGR03803 family)